MCRSCSCNFSARAELLPNKVKNQKTKKDELQLAGSMARGGKRDWAQVAKSTCVRRPSHGTASAAGSGGRPWGLGLLREGATLRASTSHLRQESGPSGATCGWESSSPRHGAASGARPWERGLTPHSTRPRTTQRARHAFSSPRARSRKPRLLHAGIMALAFVILRLGHRRLCSGPRAVSAAQQGGPSGVSQEGGVLQDSRGV